MNLLALCKNNNGIEIKRVPLTGPLQTELQAVFGQQETAFRADRPNEVDFDGDWKPDDDELLVLDSTPDADTMLQAVNANALALPSIDIANFDSENIRALFVGVGNDGAKRLLVQRFTAQQRLNRRLAVFLRQNNFQRLTDPAFTIGTNLTCVIENGKIKFNSYSNLRMIFDLTNLYEEATDEDIDNFAAHASLNMADLNAFKGQASQTIRKLIHKIGSEGILDQHSVADIQSKAQEAGLALTIANGQIQVPQNQTLARQFLRFLDDSLYEAPLSGQRYVSNSKRAI